VQALKEQKRVGKADDPARFRVLEMKVEALGAERAAARVKITTHLALSHSMQRRFGLMAATSR
jgi:hypothetical protein